MFSPNDAYNFNQIDYILVRDRWKNGCKNAESDMEAKICSDHFPVWMYAKVKLCINKKASNVYKKDLEIDDEQKAVFNDVSRQAFN